MRTTLFASVLGAALGAAVVAGAQAPLSVAPDTKTATLQRAQWACLASRLERYESSRATTVFIPLVNCEAAGAKDLDKLSDTIRATGDISLSTPGQSTRGAQAYGGSLRLSTQQFACLIQLRDAPAAIPGAGPVNIDFETCKATSATPAAAATTRVRP